MARRPSQADKLLKLLSDGAEHSTPEIQRVVYGGDHLGTARIASRVTDLRGRGHKIESRRDAENRTVWHYRQVDVPKSKPRFVPQEVLIDGIPHIRMVPAPNTDREYEKMDDSVERDL